MMSHQPQQSSAVLVSFGERFAASPQFERLYQEGMRLVEETAEYLDGHGRVESRVLTPQIGQIFTAESMKLTTRLMQLAAWLILRKAVAKGEIDPADAQRHSKRAQLAPYSSQLPEHFEELPLKFRKLVLETSALHDRLVRLERVLSAEAEPAIAETAPNDQITKIRLAFPA